MSSENGKTTFEEAAAERQLVELRRAIEETRARRRRANAAFDEFIKGFDERNRARGPAPQPAGPPPRAQEVRAAEPTPTSHDDGLSAIAPAQAAAPAAPVTEPPPTAQSPLDVSPTRSPLRRARRSGRSRRP